MGQERFNAFKKDIDYVRNNWVDNWFCFSQVKGTKDITGKYIAVDVILITEHRANLTRFIYPIEVGIKEGKVLSHIEKSELTSCEKFWDHNAFMVHTAILITDFVVKHMDKSLDADLLKTNDAYLLFDYNY